MRFECCAANVVCSIVDPETYHDTECDGKLLEGHECATNFTVGELVSYKAGVLNKYVRRRAFTVVHGYDNGEATDANTTVDR